MGYSQENGYVPTSIESKMNDFMVQINYQFGTSYTTETFKGTNFYKYFYAQAQLLQNNETKTSEVFAKLQGYFDQVNARIARPVVTNPGITEKMAAEGYTASVKPMVEADAGKINICVDVDDGDHATASVVITSYANLVSGTDDKVTVNGHDFTAQVGAATPGDGTFRAATSNSATATSLALQINSYASLLGVIRARAVGATVFLTAVHGGTAGNAYTLTYTDNDANIGATVSGATFSGGTAGSGYAAIKTAIALLISQITVAGCVTEGSESEAVVLSNAQSFDFKYWLPNRMPVWLRLTTTLSENNQVVIDAPADIKAALIANIASKYKLGKNFEPQRYYSVADALWTSQVELEYSFDDVDPDNPGASTWFTAVYDADFDDLFVVDIDRIVLVEA